MSSKKWTMKYGLAAVLVSIIIIAIVLFTNPLSSLGPDQASAASPFLVMLTDPPTVSFSGTTVLNLTYSDVLLHVLDSNGTAYWLDVNGSGTVNLFLLINFSQTIASTTIPSGSTLDKVQFTIASVNAEINGTLYPVTALSNTLIMTIENSKVNETLSGVLVDFNPTLVQIQATDSNGTLVNYYVLVPSATATVVTSLSREQIKVGYIVQLGPNDRERLVRVVERFPNNVTITSASLSVNGNVTSFNVTILNQGNVTFKIFGLTLHGEFNATRTWEIENGRGRMEPEDNPQIFHPGTIPFKTNGSSLIPLFGIDSEDHADMRTPLILQPGENATLTFSGIISHQPEMGMMRGVAMVVTPIVGGNYTVRLVGEGLEIFNLTATS